MSYFVLFCSALMVRMKLLLLGFILGYVFCSCASCFSFHSIAFVLLCMSLLMNLGSLSFCFGVHFKVTISQKITICSVSFWTVLLDSQVVPWVIPKRRKGKHPKWIPSLLKSEFLWRVFTEYIIWKDVYVKVLSAKIKITSWA